MLELKFAIYYRAASLPSQASYTVLAFFKHSPHTSSISQFCIIGMDRYRYQIFDTVNTGLRKQYRRVPIHERAALRMRKVYVYHPLLFQYLSYFFGFFTYSCVGMGNIPYIMMLRAQDNRIVVVLQLSSYRLHIISGAFI